MTKMVALAVLAVSLFVLMAASPENPSNKVMVEAAGNLLASLTADQKAKIEFAFDSDERMNWHYIPRERKGLPFKEMEPAQQKLAHAFLAAGLSQRGYLKAVTIMSLEEILKEMEQGKGPTRDPDRYFFSVFGTPSETQTWGWRVEGHHISLNFTLVDGRRIADTPSFFGSNPAEVKEGPRKGLRVLGREMDMGRNLVKSLDENQRKKAILSDKAPADIVTAATRKVEIAENRGLPVGQMTAAQREALLALVSEYANNMPRDLADARIEKIRKAGFDKVVFAWEGGVEPGMPHYYRIQGPTFMIEYDNTQNNANHIHTVWRDFNGDWGEDLLADHYKTAPAGHGHDHH